ncbi:MAG: alpha/beta hydrolase, partial [Actinomycetota bacterium]|nr:alpha/beta hydrolase [Actinomycetota bacterium]
MPERREVEFTSQGETCAAWHYVGQGIGFEGGAGRPCVVMAHGIGGTRDSGLEPFAEAFADAGLEVLLFDYRGFGASTGEPRQVGWPPRHRDDYRAAVSFARGIDAVDPERIVLWGTSWSGGHVIYVAAGDPRIAAVISQTPDVDGIQALLEIARNGEPRQLLRTTAEALKDGLGALWRQPARTIPIVAAPGELGMLTTEESKPGYEAIAGSSWRNEITARALLYEGLNRPITKMHELRCPVLVQIADRDSV